MGRLIQRYLLPYDDELPWASHALAEAEAVLALRPAVAVLSTSPPVATHLVALWLKRRHGLSWAADFRDPLRGNPFRSRRWFFPYDALLEGLLFRHADALIANTDTLAAMWHRRHTGIATKVSVIWNGFDPEDRAEPSPTSPGNRRVLAHVGSLYGGRHPGRLLSSFVRLLESGVLDADRVCTRFVGPFEEDWIRANQEVVDALRARGCLEYNGKSVPRDEARRATAEADYLLLLDMNEQDVDLQVPAKLFEYIQIGRPILAFTRCDSPSERILKSSGVPYRVVHHGSPDDEVDRQVRELFDLPAEPMRPGAWFEEQFNGRNQTRTLAAILDRVRGQSSSLLGTESGLEG
jgi:glycosyltransferase involved in cell wall biosynthesis